MKTTENKSKEMDTAYLRARQKTEELKAFYFSLILYCIVMSGLIFIWYQYSSHSIQWFWFPLIGWGLGLVFQALKVFDKKIIFGRKWEEKQIKKYMTKDNNH